MSETLDADVDVHPSDTVDRQFVTFELAGEMFAVPMAPVQEIIRVPDVASLPLAPRCLIGLANLRGRVLPILSLRKIFACPEIDRDDATRALVINLGHALGFAVDRVCSVINVEPHEIHPATSIQSIVQADYLTSLIRLTDSDGGTQLLLVLNFEHLVQEQFRALGADRASATGSANSNVLNANLKTGEQGTASDATELRLVSFTVAAQEYGIAIEDVQEIVQVPEHITSVPNAPSFVTGVMSLRQRLLPLVDLRSLFAMPDTHADEHQRIVVVSLPGCGPVGMITDSVNEVISVPPTQTDPMPGLLARDAGLQEFTAICRLNNGKRLVSVVSAERLLGLREIREAASLGSPLNEAPLGDEESSMPPPDHLAARGELTAQDDLQVVIFRLGAEEFGVPIMSVQEIVRVPDVLTRIPRTPAFVEGVINLRGVVLPVIDQRSRLGLPPVERNDRQRIMVFTLGDLRTGFIVDSVAEVLRISRNCVTPAPDLSEEQRRLITHIARLDGERRMVMLIEPEQLLSANESSTMRGVAPRLEASPTAA